MAIVRTTPRETGNTGAAPPATKPVAPVPQRAGAGQRAPLARPGTTRPAAPGEFISDVRAELGRVTWPTPEEVRAGVIVTIGLLIFFAFYIFGLDYLADAFIRFMVIQK